MTTLFAAIEGGCLDDRVSGQVAQKCRGDMGDTRSRPTGYRLPHDVADRLKSALAGYKNGEAAMALAVFLARYWSSRSRMVRPFPIDRRALAEHVDLGLSEARIRGAIARLEEIGFLNRGLEPAGSVHRMTAAGELHRKPILYGFGSEYGPLFAAANSRAERARLRRQGRAVHGAPVGARRQPPAAVNTAQKQWGAAPDNTGRKQGAGASPIAPKIDSPKGKKRSGYVVIMGEVEKGSSGEPGVGRGVSSSHLEDALGRLRAAWRSRNGG